MTATLLPCSCGSPACPAAWMSGYDRPQAAKAVKPALISGKLSNVAALQAEYAALGEQKEKLYADYGKLKKQVKEYDVIKRNIDSILRRESEPERGKETER